MTELGHLEENLRALDREIIRAARGAVMDPTDELVMAELLAGPVGSAATPAERARQRLRGLFLLKHKVAADVLLIRADRVAQAG